MKVVLLGRRGATTQYLAHVLAEESALNALVLETGTTARKRKLRRILRGAGVRLPLRIMDAMTAAWLGIAAERQLRRDVLRPLAVGDIPDVPTLVVNDANEEACRQFLTAQAPDVLIVSGTAILKSHILSIPRLYALNVHGALVPEYRNVHGDFWAVVRRDYEHLGSSILHLDAGIDTGHIAVQRKLDFDGPASLRKVRAAVLLLSGELLREAIALARVESVPRQPQIGRPGVWRTPRTIDVLRHIRRVLSG
jgi:folate-dependent phosphoribosylglycinamide formyltransferase PurN